MTPDERTAPVLQNQGRVITVGKIVFPLIQIGDGRWMSWWMDGTQRRQLTAVTLPKLKSKLERIAASIRSGNLDAARMDSGDHRSFLAAREVLKPYALPVDTAVREYAAARELLGDVSLLDAVRFFRRYAGVEIIEKTAADVVTEFLAAQAAQSASDSYQDQLRKDLTRFSDHFEETKLLGEITAAEIEGYLDTAGQYRRIGRTKESAGERVFVPAGPHRRKQVRNSIATLFAFARSRRYLPQERATQAEMVRKPKAVSGGNPVFPPSHLRAFLAATQEHAHEWLPWMAIGAFSGMRTGAILRLHWSAVHWDRASIEVNARQSKVNLRYLAPLHPNLDAWLEQWRHAEGFIAPQDEDPARLTAKLKGWTGQPWKKNGLRSSYISYRFALTNDAKLVAAECNTSPEEVMRDYKDIRTITGELVTKSLAEEWFNVLPPKANGKVLQANFR